ncbi:MAG: Gamma-glutamylputrescine oxidoreductase [Actinobacteria bacterium ADurb.BinA094]|nr:MAG: Gamma-glutamylputrescine oxidoreductase [Actinobacteria bacterium ADurb.BinA094]
MTDYRARSMWLDDYPGELTPRPSLPGPVDVDVAIVGAGFTGLWTAYYLKKADPSLRVAVLEREIAGFGASGRNGGWCHSIFPGSRELAARAHGRQAVIDQQRAMHRTVREVARVVEAEGIDARLRLGGQLDLATSPVQLLRLREAVEYERSWGFGEDDYALLGAAEMRRRIAVAGCLGAGYTPHGAAVDPARLVRGLAEVVERLGVPIYERTPVVRLQPHVARTPVGDVRAEVVVRATEAFTPQLPGYERSLVPIYSLMIGTEPLPQAFWDEVGWSGHEVFGDFRFVIFYAMHTTDGRIALGGRGAPYHYGSRVSEEYERDATVYGHLRTLLGQLFPALGDVRVTHHWGGAVAAPRDWYSSVGLDRASGMAWAGGYVGDGVSTTNLAGRTLCDLIRGEQTELTRLPWVDHRSPRWEPEPLRWLAVNAALKAMGSADDVETRTGRPSRRAVWVKRLTGA